MVCGNVLNMECCKILIKNYINIYLKPKCREENHLTITKLFTKLSVNWFKDFLQAIKKLSNGTLWAGRNSHTFSPNLVT